MAKAKKRATKNAKAGSKTQAAPKRSAAKAATAKTAARKPAAKKRVAKKPAAKKAAAMKAAPKKAAPKKAAAMKAAPKKAAPVKAAPPATPATPTTPPASGDQRAQLQAEILTMARQLYGDRPDAQLLAMDPNDIDGMDPSMFYEPLGERYGVADDPTNSYFGGFGGTISHTIDFIAARWDGATNKTTPMPPQDWLDEYVHPETAG